MLLRLLAAALKEAWAVIKLFHMQISRVCTVAVRAPAPVSPTGHKHAALQSLGCHLHPPQVPVYGTPTLAGVTKNVKAHFKDFRQDGGPVWICSIHYAYSDLSER